MLFSSLWSSPNSIYYIDPDFEKVDTSKIFSLTVEGKKLRVKNKSLNFLFRNLNPESFDTIYNKALCSFNPNFQSIELKEKKLQLTEAEKEMFTQEILLHWMYYYIVNNKKVKVSRCDFNHPQSVNILQNILEKKSLPKEEALALGAHILRMRPKSYAKTVRHNERLANLW